MQSKKGKAFKRVLGVFLQMLMSAVVLGLGVYGVFMLADLKKPLAEVKVEERPIRVEAIRVKPEDVPVFITGYGEARALNVVSISPEVSGRVVEIHPNLEVGGVIPKGEVLFRIDLADYAAGVAAEQAEVNQWKNTVARLEKQARIDAERLVTHTRNRDLAKGEFERTKRLLEHDKVGARSAVDSAEQRYNSASDQVDQIRQLLELYPIQIREAQTHVSAAQARLTVAETRLRRCEIRTAFLARVKEVSLEVGQYVSAGQKVLTLADDSVVEIHVPLDTQDARLWLRFKDDRSQVNAAWFNGLVPVSCKIRWTEDREGHVWEGELHHVVKFDQQTRTLTVAVRIDGKGASSRGAKSLPLVEGMFCSVEIPGKAMNGVFRLPRLAVSYKNTVYLSNAHRLKTVPVRVERIEGAHAFVASGLSPGDTVVTTRLIDPLENTLLELTDTNPLGR